jgi:hypothetical protein
VFERGHTLVLINADGSNEHLVTSTPTRKDDDPSFSPDGSQITFTGCTVGGTCDIWVAGANGASPHRITTSPTDDREPTFSPDGKRVVFERWQPDMTTRLFAQALAGGNPTQVSNGYDWAPTWRRVPTPSIDTSPAIAGTPRAGHVLTVAAGHTSWGGTTRFQWLRCSANCTAIPGATAATYRATNADIGAKLVARQIQSSEGGSVHADSHALGPVAPEPGASIARKVTITRTGRLLAFLSCPAAQSGVCRGTLTFAVAAGKRAHHTLRAGSAPISILSGKSATASVRLSKQAKKLLTGSHRPHLKAKLVTSDDAGNTTKKTSSVALTRRGH